MLDKNTTVKVTNRSRGSVFYTIQDLGITRVYQSGETKEVLYEEILKLSYLPGGQKLIDRYLVIDNKDAVMEVLGEVEPEYFYTEADVKELLINGSYEQLEDCLNFANEGVIELIKKLAVDLKLNDVRKRDLILEKTGFNVNNAIYVNEETSELDEAVDVPKRQAAPITEKKLARKTEPPKYKVVEK